MGARGEGEFYRWRGFLAWKIWRGIGTPDAPLSGWRESLGSKGDADRLGSRCWLEKKRTNLLIDNCE